jgi:hypothetical protein
MASTQELQVQKKRELENKEEATVPGPDVCSGCGYLRSGK